jgi:hypothetical protein
MVLVLLIVILPGPQPTHTHRDWFFYRKGRNGIVGITLMAPEQAPRRRK